MAPAPPALLCTLALCALLAAPASAFVNQTILWQFTQAGAVKLFNADLEGALGPVVINADNTLTFEWDEGILHSLLEVQSEAAFDSCDTSGGIRHIPGPTSRASVVLSSLSEGEHFFIDDHQQQCTVGMRVRVFVNPAGFTTEAPQTTPAQSVPEAAPAAFPVQWHFGVAHEDIFISADDAVRFTWDDRGILHALRQVTEEAFEACDISPTETIFDWSEPVQPGDVLVGNLSVGTHFFIDPRPTHCQSGSQRVAIHVAPGAIRYFVTLFTAEGNTSEPVFMTLTGLDEERRVFSSPERQINQRASAQDATVSETVTVNGELGPGLFEVFARDVGTIISIRLRSTAGEDWVASNVRLQKADTSEQSETFACAARAEDATGAETPEQFCIDVVPPQPVPAQAGNATAANITAEECGCFREFLVDNSGQRVLACSSDGCFAAEDSGASSWTDVPVRHLLGVTASGRIYGFVNDTQQVLFSEDGGITFSSLQTPPEALAVAAVNYTFDVDALTTEPLDQDVFTNSDSTLLWGLSSQGIHTNGDGNWILHALWACSCEGQCGLRCNQ